MLEQLNNPSTFLVIIPGVIIALNQLFKKLGLPDKYCPIVNMVLGFIAIFPLMDLGLNLLPAIVGSLMIGLSAGGLYDIKRAIE